MSELKLCKDCKHFRGVRPRKYSTCQHPNQYATSPVTGEVEYQPKYSFCETQRITIEESQCGPNGKWFEPAQEEAIACQSSIQDSAGATRYPNLIRDLLRLFG